MIFSSNLKSLVSFERDYKLDQKSVSEYLNYGAISSPNTIFSNFKKVNPSEIIEFEYKNNYIDKKFIKYWEVESYIDNKTFDTEEFFAISIVDFTLFFFNKWIPIKLHKILIFLKFI